MPRDCMSTGINIFYLILHYARDLEHLNFIYLIYAFGIIVLMNFNSALFIFFIETILSFLNLSTIYRSFIVYIPISQAFSATRKMINISLDTVINTVHFLFM